ncbi:hypothetical protein E4T56_gene9546 [Termitomyces sp. T112]|nr:hypothetical protein E4T56_gene9546 [Termitomyces sp. T112]
MGGDYLIDEEHQSTSSCQLGAKCLTQGSADYSSGDSVQGVSGVQDTSTPVHLSHSLNVLSATLSSFALAHSFYFNIQSWQIPR